MIFNKKTFFLLIFLFVAQDIITGKPLKILFMVYNFPTLSATFIMGQITGLIDKGHDIRIFAQQKSFEKKMHPDIKRYNLLERTYYRFFPENILSYDILYCQFFSLAKKMLPEFIRLKKKSSQKPKVIVCCRGSDGIEDVVTHKERFKDLFCNIDMFLPVCEYFKNYLLQAGCNFQKIKVHHSAIDLTVFQYNERKLEFHENILLLSIGRLVETKGYEYAIHAFAQLEKKFPTLRYIIIGEGPQRKKLEQLIKQYGLLEKISLPGWCSRNEVVKWLNNSHIFVHPSVTSSGNCQEGIPNVLMEAMAMGIPIISTLHGGILELVQDGISGFLVPEKDFLSIVEKVKYLIRHKECWRKISLYGRKCIEQKHDLLNENNRLERLFYQIQKRE